MSEFFSTREIIANFTTLFSGAFLARGLSAITLILTARILAPATFGQYASSLALTRITAVLFALGLDTWLLRSGGNDSRKIRDRSSAALFIESSLGILWLIGLVLLSNFLNHDVFPREVLLLCAFSVWFEELINTIISSFKANLRNNISMVIMVCPQLILFVETIAIINFQISSINLFLWARLIAMLFSLLISLLVMNKYYGFKLHFPTVKLAIHETKSFGVSVALGNVSRQADVVIIGIWLGKSAAGQYAPAITIASTLFLLPATIYGIMLPVLSNAFSQHNIRLVKSLSKKLLLLAAFLGSGLTIITFFVAEPLINLLYGSEYYLSGEILQFFSFIMLFRFISFSSAAILAAVNWQQKRVLVQFIVVSLNIILNIIIVQQFGIMGVAKIYVLTEALLMIGYTSCVLFWFNRVQTSTPAII